MFLGWSAGAHTGHVRLALGTEPDEVLPAAVDAALTLLARLAEGDDAR